MAWSGVVIPFKTVRSKSCAKLLSGDGSKNTGAVIAFDFREPEYIASSRFFDGANSSEVNHYYLYSTSSPLFSRRSMGSWKAIPSVSGKDLYVLQVKAFDPVFDDKFHSKERWTVGELREYVRLIAFTKIRVSSFFLTLKAMIEQIRGLESHHRGIKYEPPRLIDELVVQQKSLKAALITYLNSWIPISANEEIIKEFMKGHLELRFKAHEERRALEVFMDHLEFQLLELYAPEQVSSLLFYATSKIR